MSDPLHSVSLSTRDLEDDLELSTASRPEPAPGPTPAYVNACHALEDLFRYVEPGAFDAEAVSVRGGGPCRSDDMIPGKFRGGKLLDVFQSAEARADPADWAIWVGIRIDAQAVREVDASKGEVYRAVKRVKSLIEEELERRGLLVRNVVRDADEQEFPEWVDHVEKEAV